MYIFPRLPQVRLSQLIRAGVDVSNKTILDYGGARGNLLADGVEKNLIDPKNYTCMDVESSGLVVLNKEYPKAKAVHYNRYNPVYNDKGEKFKIFPQPSDTFDMVYSYSVNTHSSWADYVFDIKEMVRVSKGPVYSSIMNLSCMRTLHEKRIRDYGSAVDFGVFKKVKTGVYYINNDTLLDLDDEIPTDVDLLITFYNRQWLMSEISKLGLDVKLINDTTPGIQPLLEIQG